MLEIIREGEVSPGAEQVAERADVGLRTVFRHFKDMDSLYREMSEVIEAEMRAIAGQPFHAEDPHERVVELVARRGAVFEKIGPFKRASDVLRHRSRFLDDDSDRLVVALREILQLVAPEAIRLDSDRFEALDLLLSWESWSRLRREQGLGPEDARRVLEAAVRRVMDAD
jgi:AcrR family transcriptional regulator